MRHAVEFFTIMHNLWWVVLLVVCVGAVLCILFGLAMEYWRPEPHDRPYRVGFDEFYRNDNDHRKDLP